MKQNYYLGVDLGSTTSKAVIINEQDEIIGRGITNTRANYEVAAEIARQDAIYNARFSLLKRRLKTEMNFHKGYEKYVDDIEAAFQYLQFFRRLIKLHLQLRQTARLVMEGAQRDQVLDRIDDIMNKLEPEIRCQFLEGDMGSRNQFFRDVVSEKYHEGVVSKGKEWFEKLMMLFDKSINPVENELVKFDFKELVHQAMDLLEEKYTGISDKVVVEEAGLYKQVSETFREHVDYIANTHIEITNMVGTGYGRALLPFPKECIRSEILCHAYGAHAVFPNTRTVLDIGGQDTKAIQVDKHGLVTSFHMNDRCAAGCGRYLGYIADELNISLNELGPMALEAEKEVNICSTCTVFAGAELRELLNLGEKREDILAGLHKAIVMRAMSLLARSGGVRNEFTFTGGVARNQAMLKYVSEMVHENYGKDLTINIHTDSIFMGALGGAMFARRNVAVELSGAKARVV